MRGMNGQRLGLWLGIPAVALVGIFAFGAGLLAFCIYGVALLVALAWGMSRVWLWGVRCTREVSEEVIEQGELVKVVVQVRNRSPWPILWLYVEETLPKPSIVQGQTRRLGFLPPGRSLYLHYAVRLPRRGCHAIGPAVLESGDVFGLFRRIRIDAGRDFVTVLPRYEVIEEFRVGQRRMLGDLRAARSIFEDPTRVRGIREYMRGDPYKHIHWKSTARTGRLHTKIFEPVTEAGATLVLDLHRAAWAEAREDKNKQPASEVAVQVCCTIARYLTDGGWRVGLLTNGRDPLGLAGATLAQARSSESLSEALEAARRGATDRRLAPLHIGPGSGAEQFARLRENLGRVALTDGLPIERALREELAHIERTQALVVVTGAMPEELVTELLQVRALGYRMMVFVVNNLPAHDVAFERLVSSGAEVFDMSDPWRLREIATGRHVL